MTRRLDDMALFATVVQEGSFTAAARSLGITKQSVSERVANLERELGVGLLARSTRTMRLTDPGERFHRACLAVVSLADEAAGEARRAHSEPTGLLRITAPDFLGHDLLLPAVAELRSMHAGVRFELVLSDRRVDLIEGGFDLAVRLGQPPKGLDARQLGIGKQLYVASPQLLASHGEPRSLAALAGIPCIGRSPVERWTLARRSVRVTPAVTVNTHEGLRRAARLGVGVARVAHGLVAEDIRASRLDALFGGRPALEGPVYAVWQTRAHVPRRLELFLDILISRARTWAPLAG